MNDGKEEGRKRGDVEESSQKRRIMISQWQGRTQSGSFYAGGERVDRLVLLPPSRLYRRELQQFHIFKSVDGWFWYLHV